MNIIISKTSIESFYQLCMFSHQATSVCSTHCNFYKQAIATEHFSTDFSVGWNECVDVMLGWKSVLCHRESCLNAGNVRAVKVCVLSVMQDIMSIGNIVCLI